MKDKKYIIGAFLVIIAITTAFFNDYYLMFSALFYIITAIFILISKKGVSKNDLGVVDNHYFFVTKSGGRTIIPEVYNYDKQKNISNAYYCLVKRL